MCFLKETERPTYALYTLDGAFYVVVKKKSNILRVEEKKLTPLFSLAQCNFD